MTRRKETIENPSGSSLQSLLTRDEREEKLLTAPQKLPVQMGLQTEPPYDVVEERNRGHWMHFPLESREHQELHSLDGLRLENESRFFNLKSPSIHINRLGKKKEKKKEIIAAIGEFQQALGVQLT